VKHSHAAQLSLMIQYGIDTGEKVNAARWILGRIAPETMTPETVARRWPRIMARMIVESLGYFTPRAAANALLAHKLGQGFGCEYYCFSAGFESDGWPRDQDEYNYKLREVGKRKIEAATGCARYTSNYDVCGECSGYRYMMQHQEFPSPRVPGGLMDEHEFVEKPLEHRGGCRHSPDRNGRSYEYALELVRELASGAAHPPSLLASWF